MLYCLALYHCRGGRHDLSGANVSPRNSAVELRYHLFTITKFRAVLHRAIQTGLREGADDIQINGALQLQIGWMHIHDPTRHVPSHALLLFIRYQTNVRRNRRVQPTTKRVVQPAAKS
ncbi:hypothetical protein SERLADRAFT_462590 [Serpula lacrymans var. lacrymans S7.9]|uniref:Uncharacterized protein n=1 Tax=Serpula lacrymans var. lacrymans (strain S7.9) TaxID=578457 RepID=F8NNZ4_SERL9|nr:uncharacterized protein SERLADRAFT_462590 [Serpula lacrymans var. lacrymans S7.9]EGO28093.1 hypothetical protein SERLADRAFT_462590 [Serpula lacrymans var. lacrymans S7.9]